MTTEHQTLAEMPLWLLMLIALAGLSGELYRADGAGLTGREILLRVTLRFGASTVFGLASLLLAIAVGAEVLMAGGISCVVAVLGADTAGALYTRMLAKRAGVCELPREGGQ